MIDQRELRRTFEKYYISQNNTRTIWLRASFVFGTDRSGTLFCSHAAAKSRHSDLTLKLRAILRTTLDPTAAECCILSEMGELLHVKYFSTIFVVISLAIAVFSSACPANASVNVTQHHNNASRDGLYIDTAFTQAAAVNLARDTNFSGTVVGNVYAQPLYIEGGPSGPVVIAVTESNNVYALNATTGAIVWQRNVGTAITSGLPCGNISPLGITGTPIVDLASRSLFLDAETTPSAGTFQHLIYSLNVDTGAINADWPVEVKNPTVPDSIPRSKVNGPRSP